MNVDTSRIFGLLGYPVRHSFSPAMHNAAFRALGIRARYVLFEVKPQDLEKFLLELDARFSDTQGDTFCAGDVAAFNITVPHKIKAKEIIDKSYPSDSVPDQHQNTAFANLIGCVNAIKRETGRLKYWNTDAPGFAISLKEDIDFDIETQLDAAALVFGCGGAGRAVISALSGQAGKGIHKIYAYDVDHASARAMSAYFSSFSRVRDALEIITKDQIPAVITRCRLLVNASSLGMHAGDPSPIEKNLLHKGLRVYDVVYNRETQLLKDAQTKGLELAGGLGMLLYQGALSFEHFTGQPAPVEEMKEALENAITG